jgi:hypothetical protein
LRRVLYRVVASALVVALIPATALGRSHHRRHHHHARPHHQIHHKQFGRGDAPATPAMADNAGTVASFDGTKLTIKLSSDGSMVSGTVNDETEIECESVDMSQTSFNKDDEGRDDHGDRDDDNDNDNDDNMENCDTSDLAPGTIVHEARLSLSGAGSVWDKVEVLTSSISSDN